jgi:transposase
VARAITSHPELRVEMATGAAVAIATKAATAEHTREAPAEEPPASTSRNPPTSASTSVSASASGSAWKTAKMQGTPSSYDAEKITIVFTGRLALATWTQ